MRLYRSDGISLAAVIATAAGSAAVYAQLPERMATHFDAHGVPNGFMPRAAGAFFMPAFGVLLFAFMRGVAHLLPQSDKKRLSEEGLASVCALTMVFLGAVHGLLLWYAVDPTLNITSPIIALMGLLWVALGLMLPRFRRNPIMGVRTPWSLTSDENWAKTQRFAGYSMVIGGVLGLVFAAAGGGAGVWLAFVAFMASAIVPAGYSWVLARRADP